ncbi:unnamed protein product [Parnassius mnemosyne]|uniref:Uncharacterized protein n=1 Tax=Parnassius mnemosyne TaxID=213953 RepID=A0AAV1LN35_9NEOP
MSSSTDDRYSSFGDSTCGEPMQGQRIVIDFTPVEDLDNDLVQRKCCAVWEYINTHFELQVKSLKENVATFPNKGTEPSD